MPQPRIGFISLGCPKNLVDSERILGRLRAEGYAFSPDYAGADLVVVNTCGFIDPAVEESLEAIGEALRENGQVIVTGCLGTRAELIRQRHPKVLAVTGPHAEDEVLAEIHEVLPPPIQAQGADPLKLTPNHYAYLKIAEGCDHRCSFCIIPQLRGPLRSRPLGSVLDEAELLVRSGVRELLVVAQDTPAYGRDLGHVPAFRGGRPLRQHILDLCRALAELPAWVRLHYVYPYPLVDELVDLMAEGRILPYLDMPLQHADPGILRAMRRPAAAERLLERIGQWRQRCPEVRLRSTFIVGFPGETEAAFETLLDFLREARLDRVGAFTYSDVAGAEANALPGAVPEAMRQERLERLMAVQEEISRERLRKQIGRQTLVLVDAVEPARILARGPGDAPEVDGRVILSGDWELDPGDFVEVRITGADSHDLFAEPLGKR